MATNTAAPVLGATPQQKVAVIASSFKSLKAGAIQLSAELNKSTSNHHDLLPFVEKQRLAHEDTLKKLRELPVNLRETSFKPGSIRSLIYQIESLLAIEVPLRRIIWDEDSTQNQVNNSGYVQLIEKLKPFIAATHRRIDNLIDLFDNSTKSETQFLFTAAIETFTTLYQACSRTMLYLDIAATESLKSKTFQPKTPLDDVRQYLQQFAGVVLESSQEISTTPTTEGIYCRIEKSSFKLYADKLPLIAQMKDVSLAGLLCIIELKFENPNDSADQSRLEAQYEAISHFELLHELCEKCEHIVRKVCVAEHWPDLLERSATHPHLEPKKLDRQASEAIPEKQAEAEIVEDQDNQKVEGSKRINGLLKKADRLLSSNHNAILTATTESPGIYSPEFVQNIRATFCKMAQESCEAIEQLIEKIQVELNRDTCRAPLKNQLGETCISLHAKGANLQKEIEYSRSERFVFHTLKSYSIPKENHWKQLLDNGQISSVDLIRNPTTDALNDNLYQFRLRPAPHDGADYEPAWLHVHLKKEIHVPRQWQALQQSDVSAAHLKSNLHHHRGAIWQENQRRNGNYEAVVRRSPVSLEFIKEIADLVAPSISEKSKNKKVGKRK